MKKQMKKQLSASIVCLCLLLLMFVGSSLAWFTYTQYTYDVMTTANIKITHTVSATPKEVLFPGKSYEKNVTVTNTSTNADAYVRTLFAFEDSADGSVFANVETNATVTTARFMVTNGTDVRYYTVGYYIHNAALPHTASNTVTFDGDFRVSGNADNAWAEQVGEEYDIIVLTQATQTEGWATGTTIEDALNAAFGYINSTNAVTWFTAFVQAELGNTYTVSLIP